MDDYRIGIVSQPTLGVSYRIISASVVLGKTCITAALAALHRMIKGHLRPITVAPAHRIIRLEGWEVEGDCNLTPVSP